MVRSHTQFSLPTYKASKFIHTVGFIEKTDSLPVTTQGRLDTDPVVERIVKDRAPDYEPTAYGIATPSHFNVLESLRKYDRDDVFPDMPIAVRWREEVLPTVMEFYAPLWRQTRVVCMDEVLYTPDTSPGPMIKMLGCKNKKAARHQLRAYLTWYADEGYEVSSSPLYKQNGKIELLKEKKMRDGVAGIRGFTVPPMDEVLLQARYMQDMNLKVDLMGADVLSNCYSLVGANLRDGGFIRLFDRYRNHAVHGGRFWKGDVVRMDSCETNMLLYGAREWRMKCHDNVSVPQDQFARVTSHIYEHMTHTYILLPNGQIIRKGSGMPSGAYPTSNDGTFVHEEVLAWHWLRVTDEPVSRMSQHVLAKLYCDDHIACVDAQYVHVADSKERVKSYAQLGLELSEEEDQVSESLEGMSLLGMELRNGVPVPARKQKFYHGLTRPDGPRDVNTTLQRAVSFMDNAAFDDQLFAIAKTVADDAIRRGAEWLVGKEDDWYHVPSQRECQRRWLGLESSSQLSKAAELAVHVVAFEKERLRQILDQSHLMVSL